MSVTGSSALSIFLLLFALVAFYRAVRSYRRSRWIASVVSNTESNPGSGGKTTVRGAVSVTDPATVPREPPSEAVVDSGRPALVPWRIRRKIRTGGKRTSSRWRTVEGGLAAGDFSVLQDGRYVRVPGDELTTDEDETVDPFDASNLSLGDPEIDARLGDPDPVPNLLERIGLLGTDGLLRNVDVSISIGR
ncbi:copper transporter family protein [Natronobacterium gregoryi]|uniref:Uncharacterized protein n=2 Tax=Natronobacterium gregoryi TaxID=44930 RepID=L0AKJ7_NATGS|nr:copper transporter family protein [Natronobacterium gregoryi]AFZ73979.1 hypothetical protein Natgr_2835 [Natronobacterium gregoryi SP2]ELY68821.1 hypothetical protein C490_08916 [Natronobacterium gregoryi SP2]PLK18287.1 hypothetical protein CYV19_18345 [Natronobacterium gregoryi SP2]SFJ72421.1 hypothetical protein SAMN05443661_1666 [Natronobacterium gregoryi]